MTSGGAAAWSAGLLSSSSSGAPDKRARMKLGCQSAPTTEKDLQYLRATASVISAPVPKFAGGRLFATVDDLKRTRDLAEKNGTSVDCIAPPFLTSSHIDREKHPAIMLAESPERDRDIESLQALIRNCAQTGIPAIKYDMRILGVLRTGRTLGRGDAIYSTWRLDDAKPSAPLTRARAE